MVKQYQEMSILQVLPALNTGGVERGTIDIATALSLKKIPSFVASSGGNLTSKLAHVNTKHFCIPSLKNKNPITIILNAFRLAKLIREHNITIIHARSRVPAWSAYLASKMTGCTFVTTFHGTYNIDFPKGLKKEYNSVMTKGKKVIAVSNFIKKHIQENYEVDPAKITVIHRGVDLEMFNDDKVSGQRLIDMKTKVPMPDDKFIILMPGRVTPWKGHFVMLNALRKLNRKDVCCMIVGDISQKQKYYRELLDFIKEHKLEEQVIFTGDIKDMPVVYKLSDLVVAPSIEPEAFGRIPIEAQAMGKIIITSNIGGFNETIIDKKTGFLFESGNSRTLANLIEYIMKAPVKIKKQISENAVENAKNFSLDKMQEKTIALYARSLSS
jgi:glycosyltransferase involved in cell wall biosynthesis